MSETPSQSLDPIIEAAARVQRARLELAAAEAELKRLIMSSTAAAAMSVVRALRTRPGSLPERILSRMRSAPSKVFVVDDLTDLLTAKQKRQTMVNSLNRLADKGALTAAEGRYQLKEGST